MPPSNLEKRRVSGIASLFYWSRLKISGSPRADLDAHSDFQTDQVATYDHSHVWSAREAFALFLLLIPAAVAQGPWRVIYTKAKKGDQPCSEHGTAAASVDRGDGVDVKERNH